MGKSVQKSYDERMQDLEKRMAALKAEKKKRDARHITAIGTAVSRQYPELLKKFDEEGFVLEKYLKVHLILKEEGPSEKKLAEAFEKKGSVETTDVKSTAETSEVKQTITTADDKKPAEPAEVKAQAESSNGAVPVRTVPVNIPVQAAPVNKPSGNNAGRQTYGNFSLGT